MKKMDNWADTYKYWLSLNVPEVEFINFDIEKHNPNFEWYYKKENRQLHYDERPIKSTAYHIARHLKGKDRELIAAYKIFSIIRYAELYQFYDNIEEAFTKHNEDFRGWWSANAKNLFPYFDGVNDIEINRTIMRKADWQTIINHAATFWTYLANSLSIVIIPELMEDNSSELKEFQDFHKNLDKQREYQ